MPPKLRLYSLALYGVVMSPQQAELFHKRYFENYVGVKKWQENALREGKARSYTRTLGGRIRYLHPTKDHNAYLCSPDQGSAADMLKRSLPLVLRRLQERFGDEAQMVHMVHDEIIVECPDTPDAKKQVLETVIQAMEEGGQYYLKKVPLVAEGKAGYSWAEK